MRTEKKNKGISNGKIWTKKKNLMATFGNNNKKRNFEYTHPKKINNVSASEKIYKELHTQQPKILTI